MLLRHRGSNPGLLPFVQDPRCFFFLFFFLSFSISGRPERSKKCLSPSTLWDPGPRCRDPLSFFFFFFLVSPLFWPSDFTFIYMWTHQPGSPNSTGDFFPPSFCCACLHFLWREGFRDPFPSSTMRSNFVYQRQNSSISVGHDVRENPSSCDRAEIRTYMSQRHQKV